MITEISITLPDWVKLEIEKVPSSIPLLIDRIRLVIRLSQLNVEHRTGGPFAAAVFEKESGRIISVGVNRVTSLNLSALPAEIVALSMAQKKLETYDLGGAGISPMQLVVNWRPCVMCYGAVLWSGVRSLVIAGSGPELESITGFDEGPMHPEWRRELTERGVELIEGGETEAVCKVFNDYMKRGLPVYNGRTGC
jgi:tRNA(Arg) A34 adenosine deaminase TadA